MGRGPPALWRAFCLTSKELVANVDNTNFVKNIFMAAARLVFEQTANSHSLAMLAHEGNYRSVETGGSVEGPLFPRS